MLIDTTQSLVKSAFSGMDGGISSEKCCIESLSLTLEFTPDFGHYATQSRLSNFRPTKQVTLDQPSDPSPPTCSGVSSSALCHDTDERVSTSVSWQCFLEKQPFSGKI